MLSKNAGVGSSASAQRNPLGIYMTAFGQAALSIPLGALRGAPRWKGWRKTPAFGGCSQGKAFPQKIRPGESRASVKAAIGPNGPGTES
jgi:hypothetical protein